MGLTGSAQVTNSWCTPTPSSGPGSGPGPECFVNIVIKGNPTYIFCAEAELDAPSTSLFFPASYFLNVLMSEIRVQTSANKQ